MEKKVREFIYKYDMIEFGSHIILGISGGPDSIALLFIMQNLKAEFDLTLSVAHLNHSLRVEADEEEGLVKNLCQDLGIPFYASKVDVAKKAESEKKSIEEAGREVRYHFFNQLWTELQADLIATAHHKDDNAETVLLNLLRGTGIKGLRGIMPVSGHLIRPLLGLSKSEIENYLQEHDLPYFIDQSNFDPIYLRNKLRQELIPLLKAEYNPQIIESLNQLATIAGEENAELESQAKSLFAQGKVRETPDTIVLNNKFLASLSIALRKRVLLYTLGTLTDASGWEALDIELILDLMTKTGSSKMIQLKKGVKVTKVYDELVFSTLEKERISFDYLLYPPTTILLATGKKYLFELIKGEDFATQKAKNYLAYIDYDKCQKPLHLRSRKAGDIFHPYGLKGSKKIKDYFIDLKIPQYKRQEIPLLTSDEDDIYAVLGYRISSLVSVDANSNNVLTIKDIT